MFTPEPIRSPWSIQVLTLDYSIEGQIDGGTNAGLFNSESQPLQIVSARMQAIRNRLPGTPELMPWVVVRREQQVAVIPQDQASLTAAMKATKSFKHAVAGTAHVGPFLIRGQALSPDTTWTMFANVDRFPVNTSLAFWPCWSCSCVCRISASIKAWACCRQAFPMVLMGKRLLFNEGGNSARLALLRPSHAKTNEL